MLVAACKVNAMRTIVYSFDRRADVSGLRRVLSHYCDRPAVGRPTVQIIVLIID